MKFRKGKRCLLLAATLVVSAFGLMNPNMACADSSTDSYSTLQSALSNKSGAITINNDILATSILNSIGNTGVTVFPGESAVTYNAGTYRASAIKDILYVANGNSKLTLSNYALTGNSALTKKRKTSKFKGVMTGAAAHQEITGDVTGTYSDETSTLRGGALYNTNASLAFAVKNATFSNNKITADYFGGAIYNAGIMSITDTNTFSGNQAQNGYGGAIAQNGGSLSILSGISDFTNNSATANGSAGGYGGAMYINNTNFTIADDATVTFDGNSSTLGGGALYIYNHNSATANTVVTIGSGTEFKNNTNTNSSVYGGGAIMVDRHSAQTTYAPQVTINGAKFTNNTGGNGGALYNHEGVINISNATFTGNTTLASGHGGAIYNDPNSIINLNGGNTFTGNTDSTGANDIYNAGTINLSGTNTFDGGFDGVNGSDKGTVNITDGLTTVNNALKFNNVNVNGGELHLAGTGSAATNITGSAINVASDAIINAIDGKTTYYTGGLNDILLQDGAIAKGDLEVVLGQDEGLADIFKTSSGSKITYIPNLVNNDSPVGKYFTVISSGGVTINESPVIVSNSAGDLFKFIQSGGPGSVELTATAVSGTGINGAINATDTSARTIVDYNLIADETVSTENGVENSDFTINGTGTTAADPILKLQADDGLYLDSDSTLTLNNLKVLSQGSGDFLKNNGGTLNINDTKFTNKGYIYSDGNLNFNFTKSDDYTMSQIGNAGTSGTSTTTFTVNGASTDVNLVFDTPQPIVSILQNNIIFKGDGHLKLAHEIGSNSAITGNITNQMTGNSLEIDGFWVSGNATNVETGHMIWTNGTGVTGTITNDGLFDIHTGTFYLSNTYGIKDDAGTGAKGTLNIGDGTHETVLNAQYIDVPSKPSANIIQNRINILANGTLKADADKIVTPNAISNDGVLVLSTNGANATFAPSVTGAGHTDINAGDYTITFSENVTNDVNVLSGTLDNNATITGNVLVGTNGTLTSTLANAGTLTNNGTFNLEGALGNVNGAGTTVLQNNVTAAADYTIGGTLDANGKEINMADGTNYNTLTAGAFTSNSGTMKIDIGMSSASNADKIATTSTTAASTGTITVSDINVIGATSAGNLTHQIIANTNADSTLALALDITSKGGVGTSDGTYNDEVTANTKWSDKFYEHQVTDATLDATFALATTNTANDSIKTTIAIRPGTGTETGKTLLGDSLSMVVQATTPAVRTFTADSNDDYTVNADLGNLGGDKLSIIGTGYTAKILGNNKAGITVANNGQTLELTDVAEYGGFNGAGIDNTVGGTINISGSKVTSDIINDGSATGKGVFLTGTNDISKIIDSTVAADATATPTAGKVTISGGTSTIGTLAQKALSIADDGKLVINASNIALGNNVIQNAGTLEITGGTLKKIVDGTGHTDINATGQVTFGANVRQHVNVLNGRLKTKANNLKAGATNNAVLELGANTAGILASNVDGTGRTDITGDLTINSGVTLSQDGGIFVKSGAGQVTNNGSIAGGLTNGSASYTTATVTNNGTIYDGVTNYGTLENLGTGTIYGGVYNHGAVTNEGTDSDNSAIIGTFYNYSDGTVTNNAYGVISNLTNENTTAGAVTNNVNGIITNLNNSGDVVNAGLISNTYNSGTITNTGRFTNIVDNYTAGTITTDASGFDSTAVVKNDGNITLTGGTLNTTINHYTAGGAGGSTVVDGEVLVAYGKAINQDITINSGAGKSLTANVSSIGGDVDNNGLLYIFSQETPGSVASQLNHAVSGDGKTIIQRNVTVAADIENEIQVATYNDGVTDYFADVTVLSGNKLGTSGKAITIDADNTLTMRSAADLQNAVTNNGNLVLNSDTLSKAISGSGTTKIDGTVTSNAAISNAITILAATTADPSAEAKLIINADNLTVPDNNSIQNAGNLTLTGGTLGKQIHGTGHTDIDTTDFVKFSANVFQLVNVKNGQLRTKANNLKAGATDEAGTSIRLEGGELSTDISGDGKTILSNNSSGGVTVNSGVTITQAGVTVISGGTNKTVTNKGTIDAPTTNNANSKFANEGTIYNGVTNNGIINNNAGGTIYGGLKNYGTATNEGTSDKNAYIGTVYNKSGSTFTNGAYGLVATKLDNESGATVTNNELGVISVLNNFANGSVENNVNAIITNLNNKESGDVVNAGLLTNTYNSGTITNNIGANNGLFTNIVNNYTAGVITTDASGFASTADVKNDGKITLTGSNLATDIASFSTASIGTVEIDAGDGNTIGIGASTNITDNTVTLTSGIYDVTSKIGADGNFAISTAKAGDQFIANGGTLTVQDDKLGEINLGTVDTDTNGKDLNIMLDAQFTTGARDTADDRFVGTADKIVSSSVNNTANKILVTNIKIAADPVATEFKAQIADDTSKGSVSVSNTATITGLSTGAGDILLTYNDGWLIGAHSDLDNAIISTIVDKMYSIGDDEIDNSAGALTLGGTSLSITGNNHTITSTANDQGGIVVANNGQTLSINGATFGSDDHYFTTAIDNTAGGTIILTEMTFNANNTTAVANNGTGEKGIFLDGTNVFGSGITGTGQTTVRTGTTTFNADVTQGLIEVKADSGLVNNADMLASNVVNAGTFTNNAGASVIATETLTNNNIFNSHGAVSANLVNNTGTYTNYGDGTLTVNTNINNYGDNGYIDNAGTILAQNINNAAKVDNAAGSITATGKLTNSKEFNSNAAVAANAMDNTGTYTNYGDGTLTVNTNINNYGDNGYIDNAGTILAQNIDNAAKVDNANGGTITATGTLTNSKTFNTNGEVNANALTNTGALTIFEDGVVNVNETLANFGDNANIANYGEINSKDINNAKTITNYANAEITATNNFINSGTLTNLANGEITVLNKITNLTTGDIENAGTILAAEIDNSALVNNAAGSITATGKLTNSKTFNSNATVAANAMDNTGTYTNYGDGTLTVNTNINNYGDNGYIDNAGTILAQNINNAAKVDNAAGSITATGKLTNSKEFNSNAAVAANAMDNTGTYTNYGDGTLTVNTNINNYGDNGYIDNAGTILAQNINNAAKIDNVSSGTITATDTFGNSNEVNNSGDILANALNNTGAFTNTEEGDITVNTTILNDTNGTFDNAGDVLALDIVNNGTVDNANGGTITATDNLNNTNIFNSDGNVNADSLDNSGVFTNNSNGIVNVNTVFDNTNQVNNAGTVNTETFANEASGTLTNDGIVSAIENFNNDGIVNNTAEGLGTLNIKDGYSNDSITQGIINIAGDNTAFDNDAPMTVEQLLNNDGTLNNTSDIVVHNTNDDATLDNSGTINTDAGSTITADRLINDNATINMTQADMTITAQDQDINGTINVLGTDPSDVSTLFIDGTTPNFAGELNIGDLTDPSVKTTLEFQSGSIIDQAVMNIAPGNVLNIAEDPAGDAHVVLNENDAYQGDILLNDGTLEMKNVNYTTGTQSTTAGGTSPYYEQTGGDLVLTNSTLTMQDASLINGGDMLVDSSSVYNSQNNAFNVDNLTNGGLVNAINGGYENYGISDNLYAGDGASSTQGNFTLDLYARSNDNKNYDSYGGPSTKIQAANGTNGTLYISDFDLHGDIFGADAPIDSSIKLDGLFGGNVVPGQNIIFAATDKEILTPIAWYKINSKGGGNYAFEISRFNPEAFRGQVTTIAQYQNQLAIDDMLFNHTMLDQGFKGNDYLATHPNRYASAGDLYAPYQYSRKDGGVWVKAYANFEKLNMNHGLNVGNNAYGTIIGADFGLYDLSHGWQFMPTAYIGYNGAHQYWDGTSAYQNGGQAGFMGTFYKDNFMIGALAYGGIYGNEMHTPRGTDHAFNYFAGGSAKAAYNWRFAKDWSLQPNLLVAYNFFGQENWHTDFGQMGMMSGMLHGINVAPGLNLIFEKETFSAYATVQYMYNINQSVGGRAGNVNLPHVHMDRGYLQYGIGVNKKFTERFSGYLQAVIRNVGRNGIGLQMGFQWMLGGGSKSKNKKGDVNGQSSAPEKTVIKSKK